MSFQVPTQAEQNDFLIQLYFGKAKPLTACVDRAYLDFSRTLHGIFGLQNAGVLRVKAGAMIRAWLENLRMSSNRAKGDIFDAWHRDQYEQLSKLYALHNYHSLTAGQVQKWLNMALKYVYVFGEERLPGFASWYELGHVPLDRIMLARLATHGAQRLSCGDTWSRLTSYDEYLGLQQWIRDQFPGAAPLSVEFRLWQSDPQL